VTNYSDYNATKPAGTLDLAGLSAAACLYGLLLFELLSCSQNIQRSVFYFYNKN